jgi:hypothetical protein
MTGKYRKKPLSKANGQGLMEEKEEVSFLCTGALGSRYKIG